MDRKSNFEKHLMGQMKNYCCDDPRLLDFNIEVHILPNRWNIECPILECGKTFTIFCYGNGKLASTGFATHLKRCHKTVTRKSTNNTPEIIDVEISGEIKLTQVAPSQLSVKLAIKRENKSTQSGDSFSTRLIDETPIF